jgi:large subunit ribosomal protein L23
MSRFFYIKRDKHSILSKEKVYSVLRSHLVTEKTTRQQEKNQYSFFVAMWANKFFIKNAVEDIFNVKVEKINVLRLKGKVKMFKGKAGRRPDRKKAIIHLKQGDRLELGAGKLL